MLQKIKLTEDGYVFQFCYIDSNNFKPILSINISSDIVSRHIINDGIFTFEKCNQNIDILPSYKNKNIL